MWCLSLLKYHIILYSPFFLWWREMIKCLRDELKWGKWCRLCDIGLGYYWPSKDLSGGPSASGLCVVDGNQRMQTAYKGSYGISLAVFSKPRHWHFNLLLQLREVCLHVLDAFQWVANQHRQLHTIGRCNIRTGWKSSLIAVNINPIWSSLSFKFGQLIFWRIWLYISLHTVILLLLFIRVSLQKSVKPLVWPVGVVLTETGWYHPGKSRPQKTEVCNKGWKEWRDHY